MLSSTRIGAMTGLAAAISMSAIPAAAADVPAAPVAMTGTADFSGFDNSTYNSDTEIAEGWGRWGRRGWRGRRNRVDAGDVLTGVLIIGGIAAIASAAGDSNRRKRERERDYRQERDYDRDYDRRDTRRDNRTGSGASGLDNAVEQCVSRIERDVRIESVDGADRTANGWSVTGVLFNGSGFSCQIGNDGKIADINYGGFRGSSYDGQSTRARGDDLQWSDDRYAAARAQMGSQARVSASTPSGSGAQPAYPGGPVAGDEYPGEVDADLGG